MGDKMQGTSRQKNSNSSSRAVSNLNSPANGLQRTQQAQEDFVEEQLGQFNHFIHSCFQQSLQQIELDNTLNSIIQNFEIEMFNDGEKIEQINNLQGFPEKRERLDQTIDLIMGHQCYDTQSRAAGVARIVVITLKSNIPLMNKFSILEICLLGLFEGHSLSERAIYFGTPALIEILKLGASNEFQEMSSLLKTLMIFLATANRIEFLQGGGFTASQIALLNAKRSSTGWIENMFGMESASIKLCRQVELIV
jgi:hypothetical protein